MLNAGNVELAAAIDKPTRELVVLVSVDWNRDGVFNDAYGDLSGVIDSYNSSNDYTGALPQEATLVEGFAASKIDIVLSGEFTDGKSVVDMFTPFRSDSPFYGLSLIGCPIQIKIAVRTDDGELVENPQFYGFTTEVRVDHVARKVLISAIDGAEQLRSPINFPGYAANLFGIGTESIEATFTAGGPMVNSQWVIDYILRQNGIYSSPPANPYAFRSSTCHGSSLCELAISNVGYYYDANNSYVPSRYGKMLAVNGASVDSKGNYNLNSAAGVTPYPVVLADDHTLTCQFQGFVSRDMDHHLTGGLTDIIVAQVNESATLGESSYVTFGLTPDGHPLIEVYSNFSLVLRHVFAAQVPATEAWRDIRLAINFKGVASVVYCLIDDGDLEATVTPITGMDAVSTFKHMSVAYTFGMVPISNLQLSQPPYPNYFLAWYDHTETFDNADVDPGLNILSAVPTFAGEDSWEILKELVGAEFGTHGFDENGKYYFINRDNAYRAKLTVDKELNPSDILSGISFSQRSDAVRNAISVNTVPQVLPYNQVLAFEPDVAQVLQDLIMYPGYNEFIIRLASPGAYPLFGGAEEAFEVDDSNWDDFFNVSSPRTGYIPVSVTTDAVVSNTSMSVFPELPDGITYRVLFYNGSGGDVKFVRPGTSTPALRIYGGQFTTVGSTNRITRDHTSISLHGERTLHIGGSRFHQIADSFDDIAIDLLSDLNSPVPIVDEVLVEHDDPRLQLQDVITINDPRLGEEIYASITAIHRSYRRGQGLVATYRLKLVGFPGRWILGHPVYGVLGSTTIAG